MALFFNKKPKNKSEKTSKKGSSKSSSVSKKVKRNSKSKNSFEFEDKVEEIMSKGGLRARGMIEVVGSPEDHVKMVLSEIKTEIRKAYLPSLLKQYKPKLVDKLYQGFVDFDLYFHSFQEFTLFTFKYYPSSIEITAPAGFSLDLPEFNSFFNDVLSKIHEFGFALKDTRAELTFANQQLQKIMSERNALLKNLILKAIFKRPGGIKDIEERTGIHGDLSSFLDALVDSGIVIKLKDNKYIYVPK